MTNPDSHQLTTADVDDMLHAVVRDVYQGQAGVMRKQWSQLGYSGSAFGPVRWGFRPDGVMVQASGQAAHIICELLPWVGWHCTRIDLQVTVKDTRSTQERMLLHRNQALTGRTAAGGGRPWRVRYIEGMGDGDSLYIGSRASQVMMRVYDKERESGRADEYLGCVRYEVEFKGAAARTAFAQVTDSTARRRAVLDIVAAKCAHYGIEAPLDTPTGAVYNIRGQAEVTDLEAQMCWLARSVAPVVKRLTRLGYKADVLQALGIGTVDESETSLYVQDSLDEGD